MADEGQDYKIKGAASAKAEAEAKSEDMTYEAAEQDSVATKAVVQTSQEEDTSKISRPGDREEQQDAGSTKKPQESYEEQLKRYRWCKCLCDPKDYGGNDHYYLNMDTQQSRWEEPSEPYWLWNAAKQQIDEVGLLQPSTATATQQPDQDLTYNPKIHGSWDPNAPYAQAYRQKQLEETMAEEGLTSLKPAATDYSAGGTFNRYTGNFQSADKSADRHNDYNKSGRQMNAYFDHDAAANSHDGRSLKEERRNKKLSAKELHELKEKRRLKKEKKRMDFYKS